MLETPKASDTYMVTIPNDITMGNQQVRDIAYIAGLVDGEGCFSFSRSDNSGCTKLTARFSLGITDAITAEHLRCFLIKYDVAFYLAVRKYEGPFKAIYSFSVQRMQAVKKLVEMLIPFLQGKKRQAQILSEFVNSRLDSNGNVLYRRNSKNSEGYPPFVYDLWEELRILNGNRKLNKKFVNPSSKRVKQLSNLNDCTSFCKEFKTLSTNDTVSPSVKAEAAIAG